MQTLILARHAETEWNVLERLNGDPAVDVPLTMRGREQAATLGRLAGPVELALHTGFERTRLTAALAWPGTPRIAVPALDEIAFGRWEGTRWGDGYGDWARTSGPHDPAPGGGESRADAIARFARGYREVLERPEQRVALVAHGAHVRYVLLALGGKPPRPVLAGVEPARPYVLGSDEYGVAVELIEQWAREPAWS